LVLYVLTPPSPAERNEIRTSLRLLSASFSPRTMECDAHTRGSMRTRLVTEHPKQSLCGYNQPPPPAASAAPKMRTRPPVSYLPSRFGTFSLVVLVTRTTVAFLCTYTHRYTRLYHAVSASYRIYHNRIVPVSYRITRVVCMSERYTMGIATQMKYHVVIATVFAR